jgi:hypothetical protein
VKIINLLPVYLDCLKRWETPPTRKQFDDEYMTPVQDWLAPMLEDFSDYRDGALLFEAIGDLNWSQYRTEAITLNSDGEMKRVETQLLNVESMFGLKLQGEIVLFGAFTMMDGYARFNQGTHRVYLGVDESHGRGRYLDILESHELTHVARESRASVWEGMGLKLSMTHDDFVAGQTVLEHLFSEGFSCAVSQKINPSHEDWNYVYQSRESLDEIYEKSAILDQVIHQELKKGATGNYRQLYRVAEYPEVLPRYAHYVWAWAWVSQLIKDYGDGDPKPLLGRCSLDFFDHALGFRLTR